MIEQTKLLWSATEREPDLCIYLLGPGRIEAQGETLHVLRRQARALLYRLAVQMQPVPREELCFICWPDMQEVVAHRYLSHLFSHLRSTLPAPDLLCADNETVQLDPRRVWSDAAAFRVACALLDTQHEALIQQAIALYRGPFLSGFSLPGGSELEHWIVQQRSTFERLYLDALSVMMTAEANRAEWAGAISYAREYLRVDSLAEDICRRLMILQIMMGDRPAALQSYQHCAELLMREVSVSPLPETRAIYEAILTDV